MLYEFDREGFIERLTKAFDACPDVNKRELAELCDVKSQAVTGWFTTGKVSLEKLPLIAQALQTTTDYLLMGVDEPSQPPLSKQEQSLLKWFKYMGPEAQQAFLGHARLWRWVSAKGAAAEELGEASQKIRNSKNDA